MNECRAGVLMTRIYVHDWLMQFGAQVKTLPPGALQAIHHSDSVRVGGRLGQPIKAFARHQALAALRASRLNNRMVAAECPWGTDVDCNAVSVGLWSAVGFGLVCR